MGKRHPLFFTGAFVTFCLAACGDEPPPAPLEGCEAAVEMADPATVEGSTKRGEHLTEGSCITGKGPEVRYRILPTTTGMLDLTLTSDADLGMYVRTTCEEAQSEIGCADLVKAGEPEKLSVPVEEGAAVWVVIDGYDSSSAGAFTLAAASRPITCGDSRVEGGEECDPPDAGKTCTADCKKVPEACGDGVDNDVDGFTDCEDAADCGGDAACPLAMACGAATSAGATQNGSTSSGSTDFAGSCTGGSLSPEALFSYVPPSDGALLVTLQSATNQGVYVRESCEDPASELGCLDDQPGGAEEVLVVPVDAGTSLTIFVDGSKPAEAGAFTLQTALEPSTEVEPNDTSANASAYGAATFVGTLSPAGDQDYVKIDVPAAGATLRATIEDFGNGDCANFKLDTVVEVYGPDGATSLGLNDDSGNFCSLAEAKALSAGTHYVRIAASANAKTPVFAYRLTLQIQ
ncbi:hypothetical protein [Polyangium spumosum]|uniref:Peptidase C-terminal archaeal/bacterial domain-containing protein n=1 Tax=Polyangium spumosum TaxID=889282 RepID=A0A6N7PXK0_9BACT|nr:hypothetical protein [Polyangium spumosum]MRG96247.1 hypothetical protein [Polyangium spumosum]